VCHAHVGVVVFMQHAHVPVLNGRKEDVKAVYKRAA